MIDLTHGIPRHAVRQGAAVLANALPYTPPGVHLAVVDPGVGTDAARGRRPRRPTRTGSWSAPTTGCCGRRSSASAAPSRPPTSRSRRFGSSRSRRPSTAATSSPRWPPTWRTGRRSPRPASRSTRRVAGHRSQASEPADRGGPGRRPRRLRRPLRQRGPRPRRSPPARDRAAARPPAGVEARAAALEAVVRAHLRRRRRRASCSSTRTPTGASPWPSTAAARRPSCAWRRATRSCCAPVAMTGFGRPRRHFRVTDSTNERARELAIEGAPAGTVVTADEQTRPRPPRPRLGAPPGKALLYSAILRPLDCEHALLPLAVPLAVCEAVESMAPLECRVKWPNDVWIEERKVAGSPDRGPSPRLGGDRDRPQPGDRAGRVPVRPALAGDLGWPGGDRRRRRWPRSTRGSGCWVDASPARVLEEFEARDALRGREIRWEGAGAGSPSGAGRAEGIDERGNLLVATDDGQRLSLGAGEVRCRCTERVEPSGAGRAREPPRSRASAPSPAPGSGRSPGAR